MSAASIIEDMFTPGVSHRFLVTFFFNNIPSLIDMRFQTVSGLGRDMEIETYREGGDNIRAINFPKHVSYKTLVLERGVILVPSPLEFVMGEALGRFKHRYADVVIMMVDASSLPLRTWTITKAIPVGWQTSNLDANGNAVLIDTLELAYCDMAVG